MTPFRVAVAGVIVIVVAAALILATTGAISSSEYLLVPDRAHPLQQLVKVPGAKPQDNKGGIYYVDVLVRRASLIDRLFPPSGSSVVQQSAFTPPGVSERARVEADALDMRMSQEIATAVALKTLGYRVRISQRGVRVQLVYGNTHAFGKLRAGDIIVAADGKPVRSTLALHDIISRHKVGQYVSLTFLRKGVVRHLRIQTSPDPSAPGNAIVGFQPQPALVLQVPFHITFDLGDVGGPSAGLAFALQILQARGRDIDRGYRVAATGTIAPDGSVGQIGGIEQKTIGAREAHVDVFLVPSGNAPGDNYPIARKYAHGLRIIPVKSFQQALRALATLPPKS